MHSKFNTKYIRNRLMPIVFIVFLLFPTINSFLPLLDKVKSTENRALATKPVFDYKLLDPFPDNYENYYNDHFSLRNNYTGAFNYIKFYYFNINPVPGKVVAGKNGWLFYRNKTLPKYTTKNFFTPEDLRAIAKEQLNRQKYLNNRNCKYYIAIVPSKASIYPEMLPKQFQISGIDTLKTRTDQLFKYLSDSTNLKIINTVKVLKPLKDKYKLYHQYDHHWNELGGFFASEAILDTIQKDFANKQMAISIDYAEIDYSTGKGGDLSILMGINNYLREEKPKIKYKEPGRNVKKTKNVGYPIPEGFIYDWGYEVRRKSQNDSLPNCMIVRDSFGGYIINFLSLGFNNSLFIWDKWQYQINKEIFEKEKPDVFVLMVTESSLPKLMNPTN